MKTNLKMLVGLMLASAVVAGQAQTATGSKAPKKAATKKVVQKKPSVEEQIDALRRETDAKIDALKQELADRDAKLQAAQQQAAAAQAAAAQAQQAAAAQQAAVADNTQQVSSLQSAVADIKSNDVSMAATMQEDQTKTKAAIENPNVIHYKGIGITPGGFTAAETVYRSKATGAEIPTPFNALPFPSGNLAHLSEFYGTGRQSRLSLLAEGKLANATIRGYYEADFLGVGTTSNDNQSNSYVFRQRVVWGQAALNNGWSFAGGQMWSLATETKKGLSNFSSDIASPQTIDPNYVPGFVWTRQWGVRAVRSFANNKAVLGIAAENPEVLGPGVTGSTTGIVYLWGTPGSGGGAYNPGASTGTVTPSCTTNGTTVTCSPIVPTYLSTYSINPAPDFIAKLALDPGYGHYEVFGISRLFRDRIYPGSSSAHAYNDTEVGGGLGGSARIPIMYKKVDIVDVGIKGLWGTGVGRYGSSTISDVTIRPSGAFSPLHTYSALATAEFHLSPRFDIYTNYGQDYVGKTIYRNATTGLPVGYGFNETNTGCKTEQVPTGANGGGPAVPLGPTGCSGQTRSVAEFTVGEWYDFYKGPKGRMRLGLQYAYADRLIWADKAGYAPKGIENMFWTSFRYYIP